MQGMQDRFALRTLIKVLAGVRGHGLDLGKAAVRTGQHGFKGDAGHEFFSLSLDYQQNVPMP